MQAVFTMTEYRKGRLKFQTAYSFKTHDYSERSQKYRLSCPTITSGRYCDHSKP